MGGMAARALAVWGLASCLLSPAQAQQTLTVAAYPAVDEIVKSAIPA